MDRKKELKKMNNKGSTLVEIIISVLIVGIAFVPLLMGLTTAIKANNRSEEMLHAETVASNVIEVAKSVGVEQFKNCNASMFTNSSTASFTKSGSTYSISDINDGRGTYSATVSFSDSYLVDDGTGSLVAELKPQNTQKYSNFNSITGAYTITLTEAAETYRLKAYKALSGVVSGTTAIPDTVDERSLVVRKQTVIKLDRYPSTAGTKANEWYSETSTSYLLTNTDGAGTNPKKYFNVDGDVYAFKDGSPSIMTYGNGTDDKPENIIVYYSPVKSGSNLNSGYKEYVVIENNMGSDVNIFFFVNGSQIRFDGSSSTEKMYIGITGGHTKVFSSADPVSFTNIYTSANDKALVNALYNEVDGSGNPIKSANSIIGVSNATTIPATTDTEGAAALITKAAGKKLYDVTVSVRGLSGELLAEKTATLIE